MLKNLPIDDLLEPLLEQMKTSPCVVIQAPPGSGKTTRIPLALLKSPVVAEKKIVMLEPRRIAAVNAARWMAASMGEEVGGTLGYAIRFERKVSPATRIEVVTEGILTRRLQVDPFLEGVAVVIFDEFHERSLQNDLALALCRDVQQGVRPDLRLVVMSATLDTLPVAALLGGAPVLSVQGESHPVDIRYLPADSAGELAAAASHAVSKALAETDGDLLVFLPGSGEIRRCQRFLEEASLPAPIEISPLYGDLPFAAQEKAIMPGKRRKVVLATNIAETSLTIEGIRVVIDAGFSRQLRFDPATGLNRLLTLRISQASAAQRAGRAGRLGPGSCYRLWSRHTQSTLLPFTPPEIRSSDLTPLALELAQWGVDDPNALAWLDPPPESSLAEGRALLRRFGALDAKGRITPYGTKMASMATHPRFAHMLLAAVRMGKGPLAADLAALLDERDILRRSDPLPIQKSSSDLLERLDLLDRWREGGDGVGADPWLCRVVDRVSRDLRRMIGVKGKVGAYEAEDIGVLLALAFPERIARQRAPGSDRYLLASGKGGKLSPRSAVRDSPFLVAVSMDGGEGGDGLIHMASSLSLDSLRREFKDEIALRRVVEWNGRDDRVAAREEELLGGMVLASRQVVPDREELRSALREGLRVSGMGLFHWSPPAEQFRARVVFMSRLFPDEGWPDFSEEWLVEGADRWLDPYLDGLGKTADLKGIDMVSLLKGMLTWEQGRRLDEGAPMHITVPSGSRISLGYPGDGPPVLAVKLQEMFGLAETPTVAWGRVPVLLHLLSPAGRPIQITGDLRNFWDRVYPEVKKEMKGRYPKHPWPDDPWSAVPTRHVKKKGKG